MLLKLSPSASEDAAAAADPVADAVDVGLPGEVEGSSTDDF